MNAPTIIILSLIAIAFIAVVAVGIRNKKMGKHSCSCGGGCGSCTACHQAKANESGNSST